MESVMTLTMQVLVIAQIVALGVAYMAIDFKLIDAEFALRELDNLEEIVNKDLRKIEEVSKK